MGRFLHVNRKALVELTRKAIKDSSILVFSEQAHADHGVDFVSWAGGFEWSDKKFVVRVCAMGETGVLVEVALPVVVPERRWQPLAELCLGINKDSPSAGFRLSRAYGGLVVSNLGFHAVKAGTFDSILIGNLIALTLDSVKLFESLVEAVVEGAEPLGSLTAFPGTVIRDQTRDDEAHIELLERVIAERGWPTPRRISPYTLRIATPTPDGGWDGRTFVSSNGGQIYVSSYIFGDDELPERERWPKLAELLNLIADRGVPFTPALDLASGRVQLRTIAPLRNTRRCDVAACIAAAVAHATGGLRQYGAAIREVATDCVDPQTALDRAEHTLDESAIRFGLP